MKPNSETSREVGSELRRRLHARMARIRTKNPLPASKIEKTYLPIKTGVACQEGAFSCAGEGELNGNRRLKGDSDGTAG